MGGVLADLSFNQNSIPAKSLIFNNGKKSSVFLDGVGG